MGYTSQDKQKMNGITFIGFNQDHSCLAVASLSGFCIYCCHPFQLLLKEDCGAVRIIEMLYNSSLIAIVGGEYGIQKIFDSQLSLNKYSHSSTDLMCSEFTTVSILTSQSSVQSPFSKVDSAPFTSVFLPSTASSYSSDYQVADFPISYCKLPFSETHSPLVVSPSSRVLQLWNSRDRKDIATMAFEELIRSVKMNPKRLIILFVNTVRIYDLKSLQLLHIVYRLMSIPVAKESFILSPNIEPANAALCASCATAVNAFFATTARSYSECSVNQNYYKDSLLLFDTYALKIVAHIVPHKSPLQTLAFNLAATLLATASSKGTIIRLWSVPELECLKCFRRGSMETTLYGLSFSVNGDLLTSTGTSGTVHIFKTDIPESGNIIHSDFSVNETAEVLMEYIWGTRSTSGFSSSSSSSIHRYSISSSSSSSHSIFSSSCSSISINNSSTNSNSSNSWIMSIISSNSSGTASSSSYCNNSISISCSNIINRSCYFGGSNIRGNGKKSCMPMSGYSHSRSCLKENITYTIEKASDVCIKMKPDSRKSIPSGFSTLGKMAVNSLKSHIPKAYRSIVEATRCFSFIYLSTPPSYKIFARMEDWKFALICCIYHT